ncbi:hypothetical protein CMI37_06370 [Candidatus Pacearchaeota archaeon]|nr:hypothetical protein [Candidatus Pacearchaeota archaeon]|tara:strand:- start:1 stop:189 length:189 start_codon:yes stop_codon:yes gene_type:complete
MTPRASKTITVGAILLVVAIVAGFSALRRDSEPAEPVEVEDDDSADDDDSGRFDYLPPAPKE